MTGAADPSAKERREANLVANRIGELYETPVKGRFDLRHLQAVHAYLFQDLPHHQPGMVRGNTRDGWVKLCVLEGESGAHAVHYAHRNVAALARGILRRFGGPEGLFGLSVPDAAARLAGLYGDLDHVHAFFEGNSRTLREFTRSLATEAGFTLDWVGAGVGAAERNALYLARDLAVAERAFPGLNEARAMRTDSRAEYEAWFVLDRLRRAVGSRTLEAIIRDGLTPSQAPAPGSP